MRVDPHVPGSQLPRPWIRFAVENAVVKREGLRGPNGMAVS
jgi:hypothetical protein